MQWRHTVAGMVAGTLLLAVPQYQMAGDSGSETTEDIVEEAAANVPWAERGLEAWMDEKIPVYRVFSDHVDSVARDELLYDQAVQAEYEWRVFDYIEDETGKRALSAMFDEHEDLLQSVDTLPDTTAVWDTVPSPVRATGYINLIMEEVDRQNLHRYFADSLAAYQRVIAIGMSESFFNHKAVNNGENGRDIGFGQLSSYAREQLGEIDRFDDVDDDDYRNPRVNIGGMVYWFGQVLDEANGDVRTGTMAYNEGIAAAVDSKQPAEEYLDTVKKAENRYADMVNVLNGGMDFAVDPCHSRTWEKILRESDMYDFWRNKRYNEDGTL